MAPRSNAESNKRHIGQAPSGLVGHLQGSERQGSGFRFWGLGFASVANPAFDVEESLVCIWRSLRVFGLSSIAKTTEKPLSVSGF